MSDVVRLTVAASQGEADLISALLRSAGIDSSDRASDLSPELGGGWGGWREILVNEDDRARALDVLADAQRE